MIRRDSFKAIAAGMAGAMAFGMLSKKEKEIPASVTSHMETFKIGQETLCAEVENTSRIALRLYVRSYDRWIEIPATITGGELI